MRLSASTRAIYAGLCLAAWGACQHPTPPLDNQPEEKAHEGGDLGARSKAAPGSAPQTPVAPVAAPQPPKGCPTSADAATCQRQCDAGEIKSCFDLAARYKLGEGVPKDKDKAATLYEKACNGSNTEACVELGDLYAPPN